MRRAVLDPNVLVSALIAPGGLNARIVLELRDGAFELITSPHLLGELDRVLRREKFRRYATTAEVETYIEVLRREGTVFDDPEQVSGTLGEDPDDEYLIALARIARADALVSGDQHLLRLRGRISVLTPSEFLESL